MNFRYLFVFQITLISDLTVSDLTILLNNQREENKTCAYKCLKTKIENDFWRGIETFRQQ